MSFFNSRSGQMSDSVLVMIPLTLSGGLQDAYSYFMRDRVFANAQTGNIVLMSCAFFSGNFSGCLRYLIPVLAFALGVLAAELLRALSPGGGRIHWRQKAVIGEIFLLGTAGLLPAGWDWLANALTSFSCAVQVQSFRSVNGSAYASTMCIGNLRSAMAHLGGAIAARDPRRLREAGKYGAILLLFAAGAGTGGVLTGYLGLRAIWASCALLAVGFVLMLLQTPSRS
ncbi:YoaK family protein [Pseudoflavonifractor sp. 524-17]|uniref:YoaK family protein n=1 Tax=Pseudoflavonifractor sp. 524-17 TaxID=2304577 RepID=UPI001FAB55C7|nr:YoaK family protein [Pseudoflavonifractor sp. 524-17]